MAYLPQLVQDFKESAEQLEPSPAYIRDGKQVAENIFQILRQSPELNVKIARCIVHGSVGKGTGISLGGSKNPDFDCAILINNERPPFKDILGNIANKLRGCRNVENINVTDITVQFDVRHPTHGLIHFDLVPAHNYVQHTEEIKKAVVDEQAQMARQTIAGIHSTSMYARGEIDPQWNRLVSASFCEKSVELVSSKVKDGSILAIVRLAKYWNSLLPDSAKAKSCVIEVIAINAQRGYPHICVVAGFRRFLVEIANFSQVYAYLEGPQSRQQLSSWSLVGQVHRSMNLPIVIEPSNQFYNLAHGMKQEKIFALATQANKTIQVLDLLNNHYQYKSCANPIQKIFNPK